MEDHVDRAEEMGAWVLINDGWYDATPPRFLAILGASGAGKSSFLRAGVLPRLRRDDRNFLPMPPVRPERRVISGENGLVRSVEIAFKDRKRPRSRIDIRDAITQGPESFSALLLELSSTMEPELSSGSVEGSVRPPTIVLSIDQGEELFASAGQDEGKSFLFLLKHLLQSNDLPLIVLMTIRSDSFEQLQAEPLLAETPPIPVNLPPMPRGAYQTVIEGPALRLANSDRPLKIEPALTSALLKDVEEGGAKDALPLLAFTLERLYHEYGANGRLELANYDHLGGIRGSIDAAMHRVMEAADHDFAIPRDHSARHLLLRRAMIPWLAGIDPDTHSPRRLVARLTEIPPEARPLVDLLISQRLLSTDVDSETDEVTVEPAHEVLLRQWALLQGWLEEDLGALTTLEGVLRAARDWAANGRNEEWLIHTRGRLEDAEALLTRADLSARLVATEHDYLAAARALETRRRERELEETRRYAQAQRDIAERQRQIARRTLMGALVASILAVLAAGTGYYAWRKAEEAQQSVIFEKRARDEAKKSFALANANHVRFVVSSLRLQLKSDPSLVRKLLMPLLSDAYSKSEFATMSEASQLFYDTFAEINRDPRYAAKKISPDETFFYGKTQIYCLETVSDGLFINKYDVVTGVLVESTPAPYPSVDASAHGGSVMMMASKDSISIWDLQTNRLKRELSTPAEIREVRLDRAGSVFAAALTNGTAVIWKNGGDTPALTIDNVDTLRFSPDGSRFVTLSDHANARIWETRSGKLLGILKGLGDNINSAEFSANGEHLLTSSELNSGENLVQIWNTDDSSSRHIVPDEGKGWTSAIYSDDGRYIALKSPRTLRILDASTFGLFTDIQADFERNGEFMFSPDGTRLMVRQDRETLNVWNVSNGRLLDTLNIHNPSFFSSDSRSVIDSLNNVWKLRPLPIQQTPARSLNAIEATPDGAMVLLGTADGRAQIYDAASETFRSILAGHTGPINDVAISPGKRYIATASDDRTARVWGIDGGKAFEVLVGHGDLVTAANFSPDGKRIVTSSFDKSVRIWTHDDGQLVHEIKAHDGAVMSAQFSPDGRFILTAGHDGKVKIWNSETWELIQTWRTQALSTRRDIRPTANS